MSHTNLTQEYLQCSRWRMRRELKQPISLQVLSSPRRKHLFSAKGNTRLRGEKYSSSRRKENFSTRNRACPESSTQYSRHLLRQSPRWEKQKIFMTIYGLFVTIYVQNNTAMMIWFNTNCRKPLGRWPRAVAISREKQCP